MPPEGQNNNPPGVMVTPDVPAAAAEHATDDIGLDLTGLSDDDQKIIRELGGLDEAGMAEHISKASPGDRQELEQLLRNLDSGSVAAAAAADDAGEPPVVEPGLPTEPAPAAAPLPPPPGTPAAPAPAPTPQDPFATLVELERQRADRDANHQQQLSELTDTLRRQQEPPMPNPMEDPAGYAQALVQQSTHQHQQQVTALEGRLQEMTDALQGLALQQRANTSRSQMERHFPDYEEIVAPVDRLASQDAYLANALQGAQHQGEWKYLIGLGIKTYQERLAGGATVGAPGAAPVVPAGQPPGLAGSLVGALGRIKPRLDQAGGGPAPGGDSDLESMDIRDLADFYRRQPREKRRRLLRDAG